MTNNPAKATFTLTPNRFTRTTRISRISKYKKLIARINNVMRLIRLGSNLHKQTNLNSNGSNVTQIKSKMPSHISQTIGRIRSLSEYSPIKTSRHPYGTFSARKVIGEASGFLGGVYLSPTPREAVVIDEQYGQLEQIYSQLIVNYVRKYGTKPRVDCEQLFVEEAINIAQSKLTYVSEETVNMLIQKETLKIDEKVALDVFVEHGLGTARHQVLLAGYLIEKLKSKGYLHGNIIIDSSPLTGNSNSEKLIYNTELGDLLVFDPVDQLI